MLAINPGTIANLVENYGDGFRQKLAIGRQIPSLDGRQFIANLKPLIDALTPGLCEAYFVQNVPYRIVPIVRRILDFGPNSTLLTAY